MSQFDNLHDVRAHQDRKAAIQKEIKRYERAIGTDQGQMRTVRRMILNHPTWLNKCLFHHGQWNALHLASAEEQVPKVMWLLAQEGIDVNAPDKHNFTALELAMARNSKGLVTKALLKAGADIDSVNARSVRPLFKNLIEEERTKRTPYELRGKSSKSEVLRLKLYLHRVGAFKLLPILIKNGIDSIRKFQSASVDYLSNLGIKNAQIYQAKIRSALLALLPALAFSDALASSKKRKRSQSSTSARAEDDASSPSTPKEEKNQTLSSSNSPKGNDTLKAQTELKLFVLSANLPLTFAALMFEAGVRSVAQLRSIAANDAELNALSSQINMKVAHVRLLKTALTK